MCAHTLPLFLEDRDKEETAGGGVEHLARILRTCHVAAVDQVHHAPQAERERGNEHLDCGCASPGRGDRGRSVPQENLHAQHCTYKAGYFIAWAVELSPELQWTVNRIMKGT